MRPCFFKQGRAVVYELFHFYGKLINFSKQAIGDTVSILTKIDEDLTEEFFVVTAYFVVRKFGHRAFELQDEEFGEFVSFVHVQGCDERIETLAVVEVVTSRRNVGFVGKERRVHFCSHQNACNGAAFVRICFCIFFHVEAAGSLLNCFFTYFVKVNLFGVNKLNNGEYSTTTDSPAYIEKFDIVDYIYTIHGGEELKNQLNNIYAGFENWLGSWEL